jgi:hypothetical protein
MLRRVALGRIDDSEELSASFIRVTRISELGTTLVVTSNQRTLQRRLLVTASVVPSSPILVTLMMEALSPSETSVLTRDTLRNIPEDGILESVFVTLSVTFMNEFVHCIEFEALTAVTMSSLSVFWDSRSRRQVFEWNMSPRSHPRR